MECVQHEAQHVQLAAELLGKLLAATEHPVLRCQLLDSALNFASISPKLTDFSPAGADPSCQVKQTRSARVYILSSLVKDLHVLLDLPATLQSAIEIATIQKQKHIMGSLFHEQAMELNLTLCNTTRARLTCS